MSEPTSPDQPAVPAPTDGPPTHPQGPATHPQGPSAQGAVPQWSPPPPGYPTGPPIAGGPPMAPPTGPTSPGASSTTAEIPAVPGSPWQADAQPAPAPPAPSTIPPAAKSGLKVVAAVVLTLFLVGAALAGISAISGSVPKPEVTVAVCDISARGMVDAGGSLLNKDDSAHTYELTVELTSVRGGDWSRTTKVPVKVGPGGAADQSEWTTSAQAPQNVEQVSCKVVDYATS